MIPAVGVDAPDFTLLDQDGVSHTLSAHRGSPILIYFYPKDDTPGCTREAQDFSALLTDFEAQGAGVLGVSKDNASKHQKFSEKYDLTVPLASDTDGAAMEAFGVWVEKQLYGRRYMGIDRSTFLFAPDGTLFRSWRRVKVPGHAVDVLESVKELTRQ